LNVILIFIKVYIIAYGLSDMKMIKVYKIFIAYFEEERPLGMKKRASQNKTNTQDSLIFNCMLNLIIMEK
jgi:hypothetical protein